MNILHFTNHPEELSRHTLFMLREEVARHPYFAPARLLFLRNLFLLHDPDFGTELRKAALFLPDRTLLHNLLEGEFSAQDNPMVAEPADVPAKDNAVSAVAIQPTATEAIADYTGYLLQLDDIAPTPQTQAEEPRNEHRTELLNTFIEADNPIELEDTPTYTPNVVAPEEEGAPLNEDFFTETLARIYTKQGRYDKAIEILRKLNLAYPEKNPYFADQIRFLQKLIVNDNHKNK